MCAVDVDATHLGLLEDAARRPRLRAENFTKREPSGATAKLRDRRGSRGGIGGRAAAVRRRRGGGARRRLQAQARARTRRNRAPSGRLRAVAVSSVASRRKRRGEGERRGRATAADDGAKSAEEAGGQRCRQERQGDADNALAAPAGAWQEGRARTAAARGILANGAETVRAAVGGSSRSNELGESGSGREARHLRQGGLGLWMASDTPSMSGMSSISLENAFAIGDGAHFSMAALRHASRLATQARAGRTTRGRRDRSDHVGSVREAHRAQADGVVSFGAAISTADAAAAGRVDGGARNLSLLRARPVKTGRDNLRKTLAPSNRGKEFAATTTTAAAP